MELLGLVKLPSTDLCKTYVFGSKAVNLANKAVRLIAKRAKPFQLGDAAMLVPGDDEIVIKMYTVKVNLADNSGPAR